MTKINLKNATDIFRKIEENKATTRGSPPFCGFVGLGGGG